jgi:hypothetical protein
MVVRRATTDNRHRFIYDTQGDSSEETTSSSSSLFGFFGCAKIL